MKLVLTLLSAAVLLHAGAILAAVLTPITPKVVVLTEDTTVEQSRSPDVVDRFLKEKKGGQARKVREMFDDLARQVHELQVEVAVNRVRIPGATQGP